MTVPLSFFFCKATHFPTQTALAAPPPGLAGDLDSFPLLSESLLLAVSISSPMRGLLGSVWKPAGVQRGFLTPLGLQGQIFRAVPSSSAASTLRALSNHPECCRLGE